MSAVNLLVTPSFLNLTDVADFARLMIRVSETDHLLRIGITVLRESVLATSSATLMSKFNVKGRITCERHSGSVRFFF